MSIVEITPQAALQRQQQGAVLVDVREPHEHASGLAHAARALPQRVLHQAPASHLPDRDVEIILICQGGARSLQSAQVLRAAGYRNVASVIGGTTSWQAAGLPMAYPDDEVDADFSERYSRHLRLPEVGIDGQKILQRSRVLLLGAGGLGSPSALYLAAAGVGMLRIVDDDVVDRSNLQRQILHADARIGIDKIASAAQSIAALNPRVQVEAIRQRAQADNIDALVDGMDVVIDGGDNFPVRYLLNDACIHHRKPLVHGAVHRFEGQVSVFDAGRQRGIAPCYRCLFPEPPLPEAAPNCSEAGVLGVLPGVIGMLQATETLKLLLGIGRPLIGRLLHFDALAMQFRETRITPDPECVMCAPGQSYKAYVDLAAACADTG